MYCFFLVLFVCFILTNSVQNSKIMLLVSELTSLTSQEPPTRDVNSFEGPAKAMKGAVELFLQASRVFH